MNNTAKALNNINNFFKENNRIALAFSGGTDSVFLLYKAVQCGADVTAYYVNSDFQPQFELNNAYKAVEQIGAKIKVINVDILSDENVKKNPTNRCYFCKNKIMTTILSEAKKDGYSVLIDGTNASDDVNDRPGMKVLSILNIKSPLRECGFTKEMIRSLSKEAGLFTWDMPAYACLATRIRTDEVITKEALEKIEHCENFMSSLGFSDFRIRVSQNNAKIQLKENQFPLYHELKDTIFIELNKHFNKVILDENPR